MRNRYKLLVVEDDKSICRFLEKTLTNYDYQVVTANSGTQAIMLYSSHKPDLILLDLGLPDMDGEVFLRWVREKSETPIIILSARNEESDKVSALDLGANDYVTKPFGTAELQARVRAALRSSSGASTVNRLFRVGELRIDFDRRLVTLKGEEVHLTQTEYNILALLARQTGKLLTYANVITEVWGEETDSGSIKKLQVNMANIRKKLGCKPGESRYIINELGVGYRMCDENVENGAKKYDEEKS